MEEADSSWARTPCRSRKLPSSSKNAPNKSLLAESFARHCSQCCIVCCSLFWFFSCSSSQLRCHEQSLRFHKSSSSCSSHVSTGNYGGKYDKQSSILSIINSNFVVSSDESVLLNPSYDITNDDDDLKERIQVSDSFLSRPKFFSIVSYLRIVISNIPQ